jgi:predicted HTH transcriptional regulator
VQTTPTSSRTELTGLDAERTLHAYVLDLYLDAKVVDYLLPRGIPQEYETSLWDYKRHLPNTSGRGDPTSIQSAGIQIAELAKDVVAFHNSYGGYIIAGIDQYADSPVVGCSNLSAEGFAVEK